MTYFNIQQQEEAEHQAGLLNCDGFGNQFASEQDRADYYGYDSPAQLDFEEEYHASREAVEAQDAIEARGGPEYYFDPWKGVCPF